MAAVESIARTTGVERLPRGSQARTADLYDRHAAHIFRYCRSRLGTREEAEDAVQTTFLNAHRALGRGVVPLTESAWLLKIAHNVCLSRWSENGRRRRFEVARDPQTLEETLAGPQRRHDDLLGLDEALARLPDRQRRAIVLREWHGLSYREIAATLGVSQAAVETLIFRARRALADRLRAEPDTKRSKLARAFDLGWLLSALKSALAGSGLKAAAATGVVAAGLAAAAGVSFDRPAQAPAVAVHAGQGSGQPGHGAASASEETLALKARTLRISPASETPESGALDAPAPSPGGAVETVEDTTASVTGAHAETTAPLVAIVEEAATPLVQDVGGAVGTLTETLTDAGVLNTETGAGVLDTPALDSAPTDLIDPLP